jgi:transcriptional regulator with XRE-family HTH domain
MRESTLTGPTICRHRLGAELRRLREVHGHRLQDVAARLEIAPSTLSRIETGKAPARTSYIHAMLDFYGVNDPQERRYLVDLAREGQRKGWWKQYDDLLPQDAAVFLGLEVAAVGVCTFAVRTIPGLLQTADYASAVIQAARPGFTADQVQALVTVTMQRRELSRDQRNLHAIIDLCRPGD